MFIQLHDVMSDERPFWVAFDAIRLMERTKVKKPDVAGGDPDDIEATQIVILIPNVPGVLARTRRERTLVSTEAMAPGVSGRVVWVKETPEYIDQQSKTRPK